MFLKRDESFEIHKITELPYEYCFFEWNKKKTLSDKPKSFNPGLFGDYGSLVGGLKGRPTKNEVLDYMVKEKGYSYDSASFKLNKSLFLGGGSRGSGPIFMKGT